MLTCKRFDHLKVIRYSYLDYVGCIAIRKSTFGYLFLLTKGTISWESVK